MIINIYITFFVVWLILSAAAYRYKKARFGKFLSMLAYILFILGCIELATVFGLYKTTGKWLFKEPYNYNADLFDPHPYLLGVPKKSVQKANYGIVYTHNSSGFRGEEFKAKSDKKRIIAIGGSTTYGVGVSDRQTWPFYLDSLLKDNFEVLNFGIPGHSTVENIILASFYLSDYSPDIVIIQAGLNDLQSLNVPDLASDYSDFHAPTLFGALGFCYHNKLPKSGIVMLSVLFLEKCGWYPVCSFHKMEADYKEKNKKSVNREKALYLYRRNLKTLIAVCKQFNVDIIFVPQILVKESSEKNRLKWWIPYSENESLQEDLIQYNEIVQQVADSSNCIYAKEVSAENWVYADFVDPSHFNPVANSRLAKIISQIILSRNE
ncbi:MAG: SGNH/GDSL hydrolase family protein [Bacteroidales bacterium]|nr:SGNH/GDSL hydrolase family protein [Bacteroidales bacterium]